MRKTLLAAAAASLVIIVVAYWWDAAHGQAWLAHWTGTRCGSTGEPYCYWSGFGSVFPWSIAAITPWFIAAGLLWRTHTCHYAWWCWRHPHHNVDGTPYMVCRHHHPDDLPSVREAVDAIREGDAV